MRPRSTGWEEHKRIGRLWSSWRKHSPTRRGRGRGRRLTVTSLSAAASCRAPSYTLSPRLHSGITQEVAPNESKEPQSRLSEAARTTLRRLTPDRPCKVNEAEAAQQEVAKLLKNKVDPVSRGLRVAFRKSSPRNHLKAPEDKNFRGLRVSGLPRVCVRPVYERDARTAPGLARRRPVFRVVEGGRRTRSLAGADPLAAHVDRAVRRARERGDQGEALALRRAATCTRRQLWRWRDRRGSRWSMG
jgi:hypothetical protein